MGDDRRHFTKIAPSMAASSPLLMNAILAVSALHLSRVSDLDSYEAVRYHDRCLGLMVLMLNDPDRVKDDNLLMTTVILHTHEDLDSIAPPCIEQGFLLILDRSRRFKLRATHHGNIGLPTCIRRSTFIPFTQSCLLAASTSRDRFCM